MKSIICCMAACLVAVLAGCAAPTKPAPAVTRAPTASITVDGVKQTPILPVQKTSRPPMIDDEASAATWTPTSTSLPPTPAPTPFPEPINSSGPWLMLSRGTFYSGATPILDPVFINADGTGWLPAALPRDPSQPSDEPDASFGAVAPKGPYAAFYGYMTEYVPTCPDSEAKAIAYTNPLYILKLPENKVVLKFDLYGEEAQREIYRVECEYTQQGKTDTPPLIGVTSNISILSWSPDGRYLAFPAAPVGNAADLYLYDTQTNIVRRLTTRQNNPDILGWSPDGKSIIYRAITQMDLFRLQFQGSSGLYAVTMEGDDRLLFEPEQVPDGLAWLSPTEFIISDMDASLDKRALSTDLYLVDLAAGRHMLLFHSPLTSISYAADPIHHLLLINHPPSDMPGLEGMATRTDDYHPNLSFVDGVFQYDFQNHGLEKVAESGPEDRPFEWDVKLQAFRSYSVDPQQITLIHYTPGQGFSVEKVENPGSPSPNGQWWLRMIDDRLFIVNANQQVEQEIPAGLGSWTWAPDSSALLGVLPEDGKWNGLKVVVCARANQWNPVVTRALMLGQLWWFEWVTP